MIGHRFECVCMICRLFSLWWIQSWLAVRIKTFLTFVVNIISHNSFYLTHISNIFNSQIFIKSTCKFTFSSFSKLLKLFNHQESRGKLRLKISKTVKNNNFSSINVIKQLIKKVLNISELIFFHILHFLLFVYLFFVLFCNKILKFSSKKARS